VITAANPEDDTPAREAIGHGKIFSQTQRMPHRGDVKSTAEFDLLGEMGQMHKVQQQVRNTFVPLALQAMFGGPECAIAQPVHRGDNRFGFVQHRCEMLIR
jgi:hypothetical protein